MRYISFDITKIDDINKFLQEHEGGVSRDGINYVKEHICFLYNEGSDEDQIRDNIEVGVWTAINGFYKDLADTVAEIGLWTTKVARGDKGENKIRELEEHAVRVRRNLIEAYNFLKSVKDGSFMKDALDESKLDRAIPAPTKDDKKKDKR